MICHDFAKSEARRIAGVVLIVDVCSPLESFAPGRQTRLVLLPIPSSYLWTAVALSLPSLPPLPLFSSLSLSLGLRAMRSSALALCVLFLPWTSAFKTTLRRVDTSRSAAGPRALYPVINAVAGGDDVDLVNSMNVVYMADITIGGVGQSFNFSLLAKSLALLIGTARRLHCSTRLWII